MDLQKVNTFGGIDADVDELLERCFQDHPAYRDARDHSRFLIIGRKGSGKTAIHRQLVTEKSPLHFAFGYTFDDYPWAHHDLQAQQGVPEERRYIHSWKYLILMSLAKVVLNRSEALHLDDETFGAVQRLESFVVDSYGSRNPDVTQLFSPTKQLKIKAGLDFKFLSLEGERIEVEHLPLHIQEVNRQMTADILAALNPEGDYYVCFDQLDLGFTTVDPRYAQRLTGLLLAARDLSRESREADKRVSVVVFLRDDIYQSLQFEDKNKLTENHTSEISWDRPQGEFTLRRLMERRFGEVLQGHGEVPWSDVFDEKKEMPGRQSKYAHICDRTFLRPRDMIKFCNEIAESVRTRPGPVGRFNNEDVHQARAAYSNWLLNELEDEIHKHVPYFREYLEVIKAIRSVNFSRAQFEEAWEKRKTLPDEDTTPMDALKDLYEFSVIGYLKTGGAGGGSSYSWRYRDARARFNEAADSYRVHFGFKESLDLVMRSAD